MRDQIKSDISIHGSREGPDAYAFLINSSDVPISIHGSREGPDLLPVV